MFRDRRDAGRYLAELLISYKGGDVVVIGIPRGGVIVAHEVARALGAPLDLVVPRKIGAPGNPELALGAIAPGGIQVLDKNLITHLAVSDEYLEMTIENEIKEIERRTAVYREGLGPLVVKGKTAIVVDDGVATGATTEAALEFVKKLQPAHLVLAVPVGPPDTLQRLKNKADDIVVAHAPSIFYAVGQFYERFDQTTDSEVITVMQVYRQPDV